MHVSATIIHGMFSLRYTPTDLVRPLLRTAVVLFAVLADARAPAYPRALIEGPVPAIVTRVIDGDTIEVRVQIWLEQEILVRIRLAGIDAPELRAPCAEARIAAQAARDLVVAEVEGARVLLTHIHGDKYANRYCNRNANRDEYANSYCNLYSDCYSNGDKHNIRNQHFDANEHTAGMQSDRGDGRCAGLDYGY